MKKRKGLAAMPLSKRKKIAAMGGKAKAAKQLEQLDTERIVLVDRSVQEKDEPNKVD